MILIVGLGNPGFKYKNTPHNLGFEVLDLFKKQGNFSFYKNKKKLKAKISRGTIEDKKIILAKPQTFMNQSGQSVKLLKKYYKPEEIWVIRDDFDLKKGEIRIRKNSGAGGHKGVKSIIDELESHDFFQLKIGAGPVPDSIAPEKFVLRKHQNPNKQKAANFLIENL